MSVFSKYGKYRRNMSIDWGIDTKDFPFTKCSEQPTDVKIPIHGMFIAPDSGYGENPILILDKELLSLPQRMTDEIVDYMKDAEVVEAIKAGNVSIMITTFTSKKYKKTGYDVEFIDESDPGDELPFN
jgi:hypothetical protein